MLGLLGNSEEAVRSQISEALVLLCSQVFHYDVEVSVEALVGVKIDKKEVYLFNMQNTTNKTDERRLASKFTQNDEEDDIEAIMIGNDSEEEREDEGDGNDSRYVSNDEEDEDEDGADGGDKDTERDRQHESEDESDGKEDEMDEREDENEQDGGYEKSNEPNEQESSKDKSGTEAGESTKDDAEDGYMGNDEVGIKSDENKEKESANGDGNALGENGDDGFRSDEVKKNADEQAYGANKDSTDTEAKGDGKAPQKGVVKRTPRMIILPPLSKMVTRGSKRKRLGDSESEDSETPKKGQSFENVQRISMTTRRSRSTSKDGGLNLHIKDSYSVHRGSPHHVQNLKDEGPDDDLVFIKEEVQDPSYEKSCTATRKVLSNVPVTSAGTPQTIFLQHVPGTSGGGNNQVLHGIPGPVMMPAPNVPTSQANKPLVFFTKNHRGELVQVKPPPNMKIILPANTTTSGAKTLTLTKTTPPAQVISAGLSSSPGLNVLQNLERNANMTPVMKPTIQEPQIRVIQVTPEAAKIPNRLTPNYEREADHPTMIDKDGSRIKRPMNAFMIWAKEARSRILSESGGTLQNADVSKILGQRWKNMTREEQQPYYEEQRRLDILHKAHYPDYRYQPKRRKTIAPKYDSTNILSLSPGSVVDHDSMFFHSGPSTNSYSSPSIGQIITSSSGSIMQSGMNTITLCPEETAEDLLGASDDTSLIATPVSATDIIPDLPNLASALAASAAIDESS